MLRGQQKGMGRTATPKVKVKADAKERNRRDLASTTTFTENKFNNILSTDLDVTLSTHTLFFFIIYDG